MTVFIALAIWFGGLAGASIHDLIKKYPKQDDATYYRIGIDYDGNRESFCKETNHG